MGKKTCIIITGPTAVGKTSLAIELARHFDTDIISADSRQCFKELTIGVAKPSPLQLKQVHHFFINSHSIYDEVTAASFEQYALRSAEAIFQKRDVAIMVGGTGLYIKAFCEGMDEIPDIDARIRNEIISEYQAKGLDWLREEVQTTDPLFFASAETDNPQRLMRALEIIRGTGKSIREFQGGAKAQRDFDIIKIGLELPRDVLYDQINKRVDAMIEEGLVKEVQSLYPNRNLNALQTVGYSELFDYIDHKTTLEYAIEKIKTSTRHYAKRQITWFKKAGLHASFSPTDVDSIVKFVVKSLREL